MNAVDDWEYEWVNTNSIELVCNLGINQYLYKVLALIYLSTKSVSGAILHGPRNTSKYNLRIKDGHTSLCTAG